MTTTFAELNLRSDLLEALASLGYEEPTPIQREAIPPLLAGKDLLGQAATGTGKTAAFALPLLERLGTDRSGAPVALVLVPTRELAVQVSQALHRYGRAMGARVTPIRGGIVALKSTVWRASGVASKIASRSSAKPMSSISSASSSTTVCSSSSLRLPRAMWSSARPGVATTMSTPRASAPSWRVIGWPP